MKTNLRILSLLLSLTMALCLVACAPAEQPNTGGTETPQNSDAANTLTVTVDVIGSDGKTTTFTIETAAETLRGALEQENLVKGEEGPYGLYIKEVNGESAVYETDGAYWAVYIGEETAMSGVDEIKLTDGALYKLVYTKG